MCIADNCHRHTHTHTHTHILTHWGLGFGDLINNENAWEPIVKYIKDQYSLYLRRELTPNRDRQILDSRVHAVLYFVSPSGHGLAPLDLLAMKALSETANVVPVIAKADALTLDEREAFKARIREELRVHGIQVYPNIYGLDFETLEDDQRAANDAVSVGPSMADSSHQLPT